METACLAFSLESGPFWRVILIGPKLIVLGPKKTFGLLSRTSLQIPSSWILQSNMAMATAADPASTPEHCSRVSISSYYDYYYW
jgi:hypothetical protein